MALILGVSAFYHDAAAALISDGQLVAAAQEERFTRIKHDESFPKNAIDFCLKQADVAIEDLDYVVFYEKPLLKFERLMETYIRFAPQAYRSFRRALPQWVNSKLRTPKLIREGLGGRYKGPIVYTEHHESHAASAFFPSPFQDAAILTIDGVGEWATTTLGTGKGNKISLEQEIRFPHSLGLLYSAFTYYCGFRVNSGEYKLMGLAPYGKPIFYDKILDHLIDLKSDGSFRLDMKYFNYCQGLTMTSQAFHELFDGPPRTPDAALTQRDMDIAASIQAVTEEAMLRLASQAHQITGLRNLVLAGGVALNCVGNGKLLRDGPFDNIWIQPASGDAGGALGAAQFVHYQLLENRREPEPLDGQIGSLLGPAFDESTIQKELKQAGLKFHSTEDDEELCQCVAELIDEQNVVGWFQGRMEFGPRALGSRSILGDARSASMQSTLNRKIKFRESFRPFAPLVMQEYADHYFKMSRNHPSPYMLIVADVHEDIRKGSEHCEGDQTHTDNDQSILRQLGRERSEIPAVTHVDYSARIQTVEQKRNPLLHQLMTAFHQRTGCGVMINTSFNVRSEPIVCTPKDAINCFLHTDMDVLAIGRSLVKKCEQDPASIQVDRNAHLKQFALD